MIDATAPITTKTSRQVVTSLQAGRALAALLVVMYHSGGSIFGLKKYWGEDPLRHFFSFGHAGVDYFFVLSGFIILYVHRTDINRPSMFKRYAQKRFVRIYPIYWSVLIAVLAVYFIVPAFGKGFERQGLVIASSVSLIHLWTGYTELPVAWTLYHEILFYFVFSFLIINRRVGAFVLALWLAASVFLINSRPPATENEFVRSWLDFYFSPLHLLFGMGMAACWFIQTRKIAMPFGISIIGISLFLMIAMEEDYLGWLPENIRHLGYGTGSALVVVGLLELERRQRLIVPKTLQLLGNASYAIYLTHFTILSVLAKIVLSLGGKTYTHSHLVHFSAGFGGLLWCWCASVY